MTRTQRVLRSSRVPTYTPTTSGNASNSLSCAAKTALISRFGEGEPVWAMFGRQSGNRINAKANKADANNEQDLGEAALSVSLTSLAYRRTEGNIRNFLSSTTVSSPPSWHREKRKHFSNGICYRSGAASGEKQTHRWWICRNV